MARKPKPRFIYRPTARVWPVPGGETESGCGAFLGLLSSAPSGRFGYWLFLTPPGIRRRIALVWLTPFRPFWPLTLFYSNGGSQPLASHEKRFSSTCSLPLIFQRSLLSLSLFLCLSVSFCLFPHFILRKLPQCWIHIAQNNSSPQTLSSVPHFPFTHFWTDSSPSLPPCRNSGPLTTPGSPGFVPPGSISSLTV